MIREIKVRKIARVGLLIDEIRNIEVFVGKILQLLLKKNTSKKVKLGSSERLSFDTQTVTI